MSHEDSMQACDEPKSRIEVSRRASFSAMISAALIGSACSTDDAMATATTSARVIYGSDSRTELVESGYSATRDRALAILLPGAMNTFALEASVPDGGVDASTPLVDSFDLCSGERYAEQAALARCGAIALSEHYALTAQHCVPDQRACDEALLVRGYALDAAGELHQESLELLECAEVVATLESDWLDAESFDYAVMRLKTPITELHGETLELGRVELGDEVVNIGPSSGLPLKVSQGTVVHVVPNRGYFYASIDAFAGASGSGVYSHAGGLVGMLVAGARDYVLAEPGCLVPSVLDASDGGELVNRLDAILARTCGEQPSLEFCDYASHSVTDASLAMGSTKSRRELVTKSARPTSRTANCAVVAPRSTWLSRVSAVFSVCGVVLAALVRRRYRC